MCDAAVESVKFADWKFVLQRLFISSMCLFCSINVLYFVCVLCLHFSLPSGLINK